MSRRRRERDEGPLISTQAMRAAAALLTGAAITLLLAAAVLWMTRQPLFDLRRIELQAAGPGGLRHVSAHAVRAAVNGRLRGNFFTLRLDEARRVFEMVPWVAGVSIRRVWPDRLVVTLTEHRAIGVWEDGRLLSDTGRLFIANVAEAELNGPLPNFDGPPALAAEAARRYPQFSTQLAEIGLGVEAVEVSERASWVVLTDSGSRIELGRDEPAGELDRRLTALVHHYPTIVAHLARPPVRIDVRYPQAIAATPEPRKKP